MWMCTVESHADGVHYVQSCSNSSDGGYHRSKIKVWPELWQGEWNAYHGPSYQRLECPSGCTEQLVADPLSRNSRLHVNVIYVVAHDS
jgi:hypothetical protein